jgi:hypothetical protein
VSTKPGPAPLPLAPPPALACANAAPTGAGCALLPTTLRPAGDPNAKRGPGGDIVPGQLLDYTVEFENEGEGRAYGVYIVDRLSLHLDESTLVLRGSATYLAPTREILWDVGELAPKGETGSKGEVGFSVRLKAGLASGTVVTNQAVVYFPSVPEETPTNTVVNTVQPIAATPQRLATTSLQAVAITLTGVEASALPLTFAVVDPPLGGELAGEPPALTYTPAADFSGTDSFTFVASNGVSTSRPAQVVIEIAASPADTSPPKALSSWPTDGEEVTGLLPRPVVIDADGPVFAPAIVVQMSESIDPATLGSTVVSVTDATGRSVAATTTFDESLHQLVIVLREPWQRTTYSVTLSTDITDLAGNGLAAPYAWSFTASPLGWIRERLYSQT